MLLANKRIALFVGKAEKGKEAVPFVYRIHDKPEMVAWEFATKHFQSIKDIISGKVPASQAAIDEKFGDAIVYLLLMKGMMTERQRNVEDVRIKYELTRDV